MRAGRLRHRVTIQQRVTTQDEYGGQSENWSDVATDIPASIEPLIGRELIAAQSEQSEITGKIRMRYRAGIVAAMRVLFRDAIYNIKAAVNVEERNIELVLYVATGVNEG